MNNMTAIKQLNKVSNVELSTMTSRSSVKYNSVLPRRRHNNIITVHTVRDDYGLFKLHYISGVIYSF